MTHPQAKEYLWLPEAGREAWTRFFPPALRGMSMALLIP